MPAAIYWKDGFGRRIGRITAAQAAASGKNIGFGFYSLLALGPIDDLSTTSVPDTQPGPEPIPDPVPVNP